MRSVTGTLVTAALIAVLALTALAPAGAAAPSGLSYPSSVKTAFVKGCVEGGGSRAACKCVIRKIERRYSLRQFLRIIDRVNDTGRFPSAINRMINSCAKRYQ
jgi:hypothetical protein